MRARRAALLGLGLVSICLGPACSTSILAQTASADRGATARTLIVLPFTDLSDTTADAVLEDRAFSVEVNRLFRF